MSNQDHLRWLTSPASSSTGDAPDSTCQACKGRERVPPQPLSRRISSISSSSSSSSRIRPPHENQTTGEDGDMSGFLVPPWYHDDGPSDASVRLALLTIGFFTAVTCFTLVKLIYQTCWFWVRSLKPNEYLYMVWGVWIVAIATVVVMWLYLSGKIETSFWLFFGLGT
ncbi:hypothetical protein MCOR01_010695 [Pyricularia oryzae]|nr:hypothetical protein MCOR01_010695 [Pyricularia oryzae]